LASRPGAQATTASTKGLTCGASNSCFGRHQSRGRGHLRRWG